MEVRGGGLGLLKRIINKTYIKKSENRRLKPEGAYCMAGQNSALYTASRLLSSVLIFLHSPRTEISLDYHYHCWDPKVPQSQHRQYSVVLSAKSANCQGRIRVEWTSCGAS